MSEYQEDLAYWDEQERFDWYAAQTSEEFNTLEHPKPRYVYDALSEPDSNLINSDTFPMLVGRWEPGQVGGRA
jgi:hypothetical protein